MLLASTKLMGGVSYCLIPHLLYYIQLLMTMNE